MELIFFIIFSVQNKTSESIFKALVEQQKRNYHNHSIKASKLVRDVRLGVLQDVYYPPHDKHNLVNSLTLQQVSNENKKKKYQIKFFVSAEGIFREIVVLVVSAGTGAGQPDGGCREVS